MNKTKTIKLGFFPFWVVVVYGGDFNEMVDAAVKAEPLLSPGFFEESRKSIASVYSDKDSNVCVMWIKPKAYERGTAAFYATVAHESLHVISAMRLSLGVDHLGEETYAYLLQHLMEEIGSDKVEEIGSDGGEGPKTGEMQLVGDILAKEFFDQGTTLYTIDGDVITKIDRRRSHPFFCEKTGRWHGYAYVATHPAR